MNTFVAIVDFVTALLYSAMAYDAGTAHQFTDDPRWTAEQVRANRQTMRISYFMMGLAVACGACIIPMAIIDVAFWHGPWWGDLDAVLSVALVVGVPFCRRKVRDTTAHRYRLIG